MQYSTLCCSLSQIVLQIGLCGPMQEFNRTPEHFEVSHGSQVIHNVILQVRKSLNFAMLRDTLNVTPDRVVCTKQQSITGSLSGGVLAPDDSAGSMEDDLAAGFEPLSANCVPYRAPHQRRPNPVLLWVAAPPMTVVQNCHTKRHCVLPVRVGFSPRSRRVKHLNCSHPQKARVPISWSSVGMTTSWSAMQLRKASFPICVKRGGSQM